MAESLPPVPAGFVATREALHRVAERVLAPARERATGHEIALEARPGGFGTPVFPDGGWVAITRGGRLETGTPAGPTVHPLECLREAAEAAGLPEAGTLSTKDLHIDPEAADVLAAVYAFGDRALRVLRAEAPPEQEPSPIRLWPEHFDIAYEEGVARAGRRAGYGVSPGDADHEEPYAYVTPWSPPPGPLWNATAFAGAVLPWSQLRASADPQAAVLVFWRERREVMRARGSTAPW